MPEGKEEPAELSTYQKFRNQLTEKGLTAEDYEVLEAYYNGDEKKAKNAVANLQSGILRSIINSQKAKASNLAAQLGGVLG